RGGRGGGDLQGSGRGHRAAALHLCRPRRGRRRERLLRDRPNMRIVPAFRGDGGFGAAFAGPAAASPALLDTPPSWAHVLRSYRSRTTHYLQGFVLLICAFLLTLHHICS